MALMTVNDEGSADFRSKNRWSASKKLDVVLRLLRGEKLEEVSREVGVEAHRLAAWRDEFLDAGKEGLKGNRATTEEDRRLRDAERKIGELTLENEIWKKVAEKKGAPDAAAEAAAVSAEMAIPLASVCRVTGAPRSTIYHRRSRGESLGCRPGPKTLVSDEVLTERIRQVITTSSFAGEGHRKVRAHLRREHQLCVGKNRVLRLMRNAGLLAPQRAAKRRRPRVHDGRIITDAPNVRWGTDATMAWTRNDGWVWVFALLDHYTDEAWAHVAKVGNRSPPSSPSTTRSSTASGSSGPTWPGASSSATTGAASIVPTTSRAPSTGWASRTMPPSSGSLRATASLNDSCGPSKSSASGLSSSRTWTISAKGSPPSSRPTTTSGSSNA